MRRVLIAFAVFAAGVTSPAAAQRPTRPPALSHAPKAPPAGRHPGAAPEVERRGKGQADGTQHVRGNHWYGHAAPNDGRFHLDHPFEHGRFAGIGPSHRYSVLRIDRDLHRVWLPGGFYFEIAAWDWLLTADWCWDCNDNFVLYEDPDHLGWYLLLDLQTGAYVHVLYFGT